MHATAFQLDLLGSAFCTVYSTSQRYTPLGTQAIGAEKPLALLDGLISDFPPNHQQTNRN